MRLTLASMLPIRAFIVKMRVLLTTYLLTALVTHAALKDYALNDGVVVVSVYAGANIERQGSGFVIQTDRLNGYVVTSTELIRAGRTLTVRLPGSAAELIAQPLSAPDDEVAVLKVNGLFTVPLAFSRDYEIGHPVWSVHRLAGEGDYLVSSQGRLASVEQSGSVDYLLHSAGVGIDNASMVVNECGHVVGVNIGQRFPIRTPAEDSLTRALGVEGVAAAAGRHNIRLNYVDGGCVSAIEQAREEAARASEQARVAVLNAESAQAVARDLEQRLSASNQRNEGLVQQTELARARAEQAMAAAELARRDADETRLELERRTATIKAETGALMQSLERDRRAAEERYREALDEQQQAALSRERLWLAFSLVALVVIVTIGLLLWRRTSTQKLPLPVLRPGRSDAADPDPDTVMHNESLVEYVLDGRDEDGIRYLLRISGDQMKNGEGIIIGRNPQDSPYIINHADVSRKHARMRVMKNRVFIEDLGSTNGTSVNGQSIDDKGPVSVDNGDQIIIGSVVMKLRVLDA